MRVSTGSEHHIIVAAGWSYRTNDHGWVIYRDPETGFWHTRSDAVAMIQASAAARNPTAAHPFSRTRHERETPDMPGNSQFTTAA